MDSSRPDIDVRHLLNAQTGRIGWSELQRLFARGLLLYVAPGPDLVEVAAGLVKNDNAGVESWLQQGILARVSTVQAKAWHADGTEFWAVVTAPWVLIQEIAEADKPA